MSFGVLLAGPWDSLEALKIHVKTFGFRGPKKVVFEVLKGPRGVKIPPQTPLGPILEPLELLEAS